ncbi:TMC [Lepeophtheirus salmonis]|uniref:TMC n=1 Tax=Lepeophtheirus salmonis TaxID=72036 RepID=A0A7R8H3V9_LEPSM|nr:TMC [Lepeophtheirus salmonis]CAF2840313.1 TMC [Lepeophtheirus salmonis]
MRKRSMSRLNGFFGEKNENCLINYEQKNSKVTDHLDKSSHSSSFSRWKKILFHRSKLQERIEGRYGSSVYSVFKFMKWIASLNLLNATIVFFLIYLPHAIKDRRQNQLDDTDSTCIWFDNRYVLESKVLDCCSLRYNKDSDEAWDFFFRHRITQLLEKGISFFTRYNSRITLDLFFTTFLCHRNNFPYIFERLVDFEDYEHKTSLVILIGRSLVCPHMRGCASLTDGSVIPGYCISSLNGVDVKACTNENNYLGVCKRGICWETYIGQQMYTLAIIDLLSSLVSIFLLDFPRSLLFKKIIPFLGTVEFNIGKHVLDAVDSQTICWLGLFYTPFISLIISITNFILFYIKSFYVLKVCTPVFSESKASPLFKTSVACGPFRDIDCSGIYSNNTIFCITYDYIIKTIMEQTPFVQRVLFLMSESLVLYGIAGFSTELNSLRDRIVMENKELFKVIEDKRYESHHQINYVI